MNRIRSLLLRDLRTAQRRLAELRHPAVFRALELVVSGVALLWGGAVARLERLFGQGVYAAFSPSYEGLWSAFFLVVGVVIAYAALTRSAWVRLQVMGVTALSFSQIAYRLHEGGQAPIAPLVYAYVGILLPVLVGVYLLLHLVLDDAQAAPPPRGRSESVSE